jgi:hypothetical protein
MHKGNPQCDCDWVSRQDRAGISSSRPGMGFWTCATGACEYYSEFINGQTREEAKNYPVRVAKTKAKIKPLATAEDIATNDLMKRLKDIGL